MRKSGVSSISGLIQKLAVLASVFILIVSCSSDTGSKDSDENVKTIQTYLENEFTGPSDELRKVLEQYSKGDPSELEAYLEENYKPLVMDLEKIVSSNYALVFLRFAYGKGYQLQPTNIDIQKIDNTQNDAYNYEVKVEYSKDGQTNTATITGRINLNDDGKISIIRNMDDGGLLENKTVKKGNVS